MDDFFDFDDDIRKATTQREDRLERERIAREKKIEEDRIAREKKIEEDRIAREKKIEEDRIAREKRIHSNTVECEEQFNAQKKSWFEKMATKTRAHILKLISEGETEWEIRVKKSLSTYEIDIAVGSGNERISKSITVGEIYGELFDKLRERYSVKVQIEAKESLRGPYGSSCGKFTPTGGITGMTCRCGLGRSEHTSTPPHIESFTISQK